MNRLGTVSYLCIGAAVVLLLVLTACTSTPTSTRLTQDDLDVTVNEMAASLSGSDFLAERTTDSPQIVIVTNKVQNLTDDIIPVAEQWMLVARVQSTLPIRAMSDQKNIKFVLPPERVAEMRLRGFEGEMPAGLEPTHLMSATFMSSRRAGRRDKAKITTTRTNYYYLEYSITGLDDRQVIWTDAFEFKREAFGKIID